MKIYNSVTELIGNTPLLDAKNFAKTIGFNGRLLVKLEYFNPVSAALYAVLFLSPVSEVFLHAMISWMFCIVCYDN